MNQQDYMFLTTWFLPARVETVWEELTRPERWPKWWGGLLSVRRIEEGDVLGIGAVRRFTWVGWLPYLVTVNLRVTQKERPRLIVSQASGSLEGVGTWRLEPAVGGTTATYEWNVRTTNPVMNALGVVCKPLFSWNHNVVMDRGLEGLTEWLTSEAREGET